jgi:hypothetical protein
LPIFESQANHLLMMIIAIITTQPTILKKPRYYMAPTG